MNTPLRPEVVQSEISLTVANLTSWVAGLDKVPGVDVPVADGNDSDIAFWANLSQELALAASKLNMLAQLIDSANQ